MTEEVIDVESIKSRLHEAVENIDDVDFLKALAETISMKYVPSDTVVLTERQKKALDKSYEDYKQGRFLTEEQANEKVERWLKE